MNARTIGFVTGLVLLTATIVLPPPTGMSAQAWIIAGLVGLMATWWMTEAIPLTATALMPFVVLPFAGIMTAKETAATYYSPTLFLILGGAFLALAIERTGLHRRLALALLEGLGSTGGASRLLFAFMMAAAILSMAISNTSTTLIMMPMAIAVIEAGGIAKGDRKGLAGALPMGIAFAASIGGLGTIVGSPTNAIAVALLDTTIGVHVSFAQWSMIGVPVVLAGVPLATWIIARTQAVAAHPFDIDGARRAIHVHPRWSEPEKRLMPLVVVAFALWMGSRALAPFLPEDSLTDGTVAIGVSLLLFMLPDGTGRRLLTWEEANRAPWDVIMMFGGGLALAAGMGRSGLAEWLGQSLLPLSAVPLPLVALAITAMVILVTEFASNVATASGIMPVIASLTVALGVDPLLLAMPAALAASWGFMLPAGTGPNAIAWATGRIELPRMIRAGFLLDVAGAPMIVAVVWIMATLAGRG
ncbi:SLC13 family permease [Novosphingobium mangrovi (ex Huang et al. 2023)]|uniref:DASS family sodium-coupled anion symporter n=1 Tax=Novosphingobium mangrovi (ex Huang et al. 2023) TaxID=2976432 RepID=A0ABT2HZM7_9SPHN|nr:DASS family sodium-coupled anion symporter [Novosphingobium mangrovi (ex Huang et al. 2023)]MCT2398004.1 DASS family sodium-coupled anion symporter [Novosphingobium mangrovi (ex Huang et al. 2023)]